MQRHALALAQVVDDRLADAIVIDLERRERGAGAADEVGRPQQGDAPRQLARVQRRGGVEGSADDLLGQRRDRHREDLEHAGGGGIELRHAGPDGLVQARLPRDGALGGGVAHELADEQRVAAGLVGDAHGLGRLLRREVREEQAGEPRGLLGIERAQADMPDLAGELQRGWASSLAPERTDARSKSRGSSGGRSSSSRSCRLSLSAHCMSSMTQISGARSASRPSISRRAVNTRLRCWNGSLPAWSGRGALATAGIRPSTGKTVGRSAACWGRSSAAATSESRET